MTKKIAVIGGGITGLSAAHRLTELQNEKNLDIEVILIEKSNKLGGAVTTIKKDG
ncbi:MAG: FAD-dependent oxidoreductase, partial [Thermodesulfobacteriales bacterium]